MPFQKAKLIEKTYQLSGLKKRRNQRLMVPIPPLAGPRALENLGPYPPTRFKERKFDGFVKSPSAALRFNPAPLDNNPALGIQGEIP
jgi:hypothetical protein